MTERTPPLALVALLLALLLGGCASTPDEDTGDPPDLGKATVRFGAGMADAISRGTKTAYRGARGGFQEPEADEDFGPYPKGYPSLVKKHFVRVLRYPDSTRFQMARPERGYLNQGLLRGGGVAWRGWLVDVDVQTKVELTRHVSARRYVVRIRDGEIIDVHTDDTLLKRHSQR